MAEKIKKVTNQLAAALAMQVISGIKEVKNEVQKRRKSEFLKSKEYKEISELNRQHKKLEKQLYAAERRIEKEYDLNIYLNDTVEVAMNCHVKLDDKKIKYAIVAANHIKNIPIDSVVSYVIKEELQRKETPCD